jgi:hypothetical protein
MSFEQYRWLLNKEGGEKPYTRFVAGAMAGMAVCLHYILFDRLNSLGFSIYPSIHLSLPTHSHDRSHNHAYMWSYVRIHKHSPPLPLALLPSLTTAATPFVRLLSAVGATSVFFTYPLDLVRARLAFQVKHNRYSGVIDALQVRTCPPLRSSSSGFRFALNFFPADVWFHDPVCLFILSIWQCRNESNLRVDFGNSTVGSCPR